MSWYHHPATVDRLAAAYVLGTLRGPGRRRFQALLPRQTLLRLAVEDWTQRLAPLLVALPPVQPSPALWLDIARRTDATKPARPEAWWRRVFAGIPASTLAIGILLGAMGPALWNAQLSGDPQAQLPASYVGVLATGDGKPGLIVSSLRHGRSVDIKQVAPVVVPQGMQLYLWRISADGSASPLGPMQGGKWVQMPLPEPAEKIFFQAVELAVSVEQAGSSPQVPALPFVYRGLCGKLWK